MNKHRKFQTAASLGAGLLLLAAALAAWGITVTLQDGTTSIGCTTTGVTTIDPNGDITVPVEAGCLSGGGGEPPPLGSFTLSVSKPGTGSGTVTSTPGGINCGGTCSAPYSDGTSVSLTPTPASGSTFGGWGGACSGSGPCTLSMTANRSVTATFNADAGPPGACGTTPPDVEVVDTGNLNVAWPTTEYARAPAAVMAFKVHVPSTFSGRDDFRATKLPPATAGKAIVVSSCPGSVQPVAATACILENVTDSALVRLSANSSDNKFIYCKLTPGQTYYINAFSKRLLSDSGFNCSSTSTCKFHAFRGQPY